MPTDYGWGYRRDKKPKGLGYFGALPGRDNTVMTELSMGVTFDDQDIDIPAIVPTLNRSELEYLLAGNKPTKGMMEKAVAHARKRIKNKQSPYAEEGEQQPIPRPDPLTIGPYTGTEKKRLRDYELALANQEPESFLWDLIKSRVKELRELLYARRL